MKQNAGVKPAQVEVRSRMTLGQGDEPVNAKGRVGERRNGSDGFEIWGFESGELGSVSITSAKPRD